jgi:signal transduction histidine kinase
VSYATLALFAVIAILVYAMVINAQGRDLARREIEILETVREASDE